MKFVKKPIVLLFIATVFLSACRNNNPEHAIDETTETGKPGDTVQVVNTSNKFEGMGAKDAKEVYAFVRNFKAALRKGDAKAVASMTWFPLRLNFQNGSTKSKHSTINNEAELAKRFGEIFTKDLVAEVVNQDTTDLFANYQGLMLGNSGEMWANIDSTGAIKLMSINMPK